MKDIEAYRKEIDAIDDQILKLLNERMEHVKAIGRVKQTTGTAIYRPEREKEILDRLKSLNQGALKAQAIDAIFLEVFAVRQSALLLQRYLNGLIRSISNLCQSLTSIVRKKLLY